MVIGSLHFSAGFHTTFQFSCDFCVFSELAMILSLNKEQRNQKKKKQKQKQKKGLSRLKTPNKANQNQKKNVSNVACTELRDI